MGAMFHGPIMKAQFLERPNRFVLVCELDGKQVKAYLPNPGRLWELLLPGSIVYLVNEGDHRKLPLTAVAVESNGRPVPLHTIRANALFRELLEAGKLRGLEGWSVKRAEVTYGHSRFDFLLERGGEEMIVEVKSCTLFGNNLAMFPDAVTERGRRHLEELAELGKSGMRTAVVFLVHSKDARYFLPEYHTDLEFSRTLYELRDRIMIKPYSIGWDVSMRPTGVREAEIPWQLLEREMHDGGAYVLALRLKRDRRVEVGGMGSVLFKRGYYLYVGSAMRGLEKRLARHRRKTKKHRWHIDYLRAEADSVNALAVRSGARFECELADAVSKISDSYVEGFGSSDCSCTSHLFYMKEDPIRSTSFINVLMRFRIRRLEGELKAL